MSEISIGTSGWSYKEWEGVFYPKGEKSKLTFYSKYYKTVEIDSTFYAYPKSGLVHGLARFTPEDFVFSAKLPKLITHDKKLELGKGIKKDLLKFLDLMKPLLEKRKMGPLLIQLPPSFTYGTGFDKLKAFFGVLPTDLSFAVEFRNKSWLRAETWELLTKNNVANTIVDEPLLPPDPVVTADFAFVRWHGHGERPWYNYRYDDKELKPWAGKLGEIGAKTKKVYGYFNNHFHGFAIENSLKTLAMIGKATPEDETMLESVRKYLAKPQPPRPDAQATLA